MRLAYLLTRGDEIGGAQSHVFNLANFFAEKGNEVLIIYGGSIDILSKFVEGGRVQTIWLKNFRNESWIIQDFYNVFKVHSILSSFAPDIVHLHSTKAGLLFRLLSLANRYPIVYTVHGWGFSNNFKRWRSFIIQVLERFLNMLIDHYILVSKFDLEAGKSKRIIDNSNSTLIYNGVSRGHNNRREYTENATILKVIMVARFDDQKDHETLFKAIKDLDFCVLLLVGDGPRRSEFEKIYRNGNFKCLIKFLGRQFNVREFLREADIFCLISNYEGFPISTIEAMSEGLPVIVTNVGGAAEVINHGYCGYAIERGDSKSLERVFKEVHHDRKKLRLLGENAIRVFNNYFDETGMYKSLFSVYQNLLEKEKLE